MFKAAANAVYRRAKAVQSGGPAPAFTVGPTWTDNGDGTGDWSGTTDITSYAGLDYGTVSGGPYADSAFDYSTYPTFELGTAHVIPLPDVGAGGTLAAGTYYGRWWAGTPAGFSGYISAEQTFVVTVFEASQVMVPGGGYIEQTTEYQYQVPGAGYINEGSA